MRVIDMTPRQLDWCVAVVKGSTPVMLHDHYRAKARRHGIDPTWHISVQQNIPVFVHWDGETEPLPKYSTDWGHGGPIIGKEGITLRCGLDGWDAELDESGAITHGKAPLVAAMRCYVVANLGEEIELPGALYE